MFKAIGIAAATLGRHMDVDEAIEVIQKSELCEDCRLGIVTSVAGAFYRVGDHLRAIDLIRGHLSVRGESPSDEACASLLKIESGTGDVSGNTYLEAFLCWKARSAVPSWFLLRAICGLSHDEEYRKDAVYAIEELSTKGHRKLQRSAIDHLLELIAGLIDDDSQRPLFHRALSILLQQAPLDNVFSKIAPAIARQTPKLSSGLVSLYRHMRKEGALKVDISPYAEALRVAESSDRRSTLETLHPEVREAVSMLLNDRKARKRDVPSN